MKNNTIFKISTQVLISICAFVQVANAEAALKGVTSTCFGGQTYHPAQADVYVFNAESSRSLSKMVEELARQEPTVRVDTGDTKADEDTSAKNLVGFLNVYNRFVKSVRSSRAVLRTKSDATGAFTAIIPDSVQRVLIVSIIEPEDEAYMYATASVDMRAPARNTVVLDFYRDGDCAVAEKRACDKAAEIRNRKSK